MKHIIFSVIFISAAMTFLSCSMSGNKTAPAPQSKPGDEQSILADTTKIKSDISDIVNSITSDNPDTTKLKKAAGDIMSTDVNILSDSGINKLTGNDPSAKQAGAVLKKLRDATGLTPAALDSMKKTISTLDQ